MADVGTVAIGEAGIRDGLQRWTIAWTSNGDGNATITTTEITGTIERITFLPSAVSGDVPSDNYDVTLLDDDGVDVLRAKGANLSDTTVLDVSVTDETAVLPFPTAGPLDLSVSAAGDTNSGTIRLFVRR